MDVKIVILKYLGLVHILKIQVYVNQLIIKELFMIMVCI